MRSNNPNIRRREEIIKGFSAKTAKTAGNAKTVETLKKAACLGLAGREWLACALICALLLPIFSMPAAASAGYAAGGNTNSEFEPVNEDLFVWTEIWRNLNARAEAWATPKRAGNTAHNSDDTKDKKKGEKKTGSDVINKTKKIEPKEAVNALHTAEAENVSGAPEVLARKVRRLETRLPAKKSMTVGESIELAALPLDERGNPVHGVSPAWKSSNSEILKIEGGSRAIAVKSGEAELTTTAGEVEKSTIIKIINADKLTENRLYSSKNNLSTPPMSLDQLPEAERESVFSPENNLGNPPGQTEMESSFNPSIRTRERPGNANFNFGVPVAGLPGRGLDASVGLTYNSRVWNKSGFNHFVYDVEESWFAAGFNLSLGYLDMIYPHNGVPVPFALTDSDGTRHELRLKTENGTSYYETTDGTFIRVDGYTATYPNGTKIRFWTDGGINGSIGRHFPTSITDRHGNFIQTVYEDTKGRLKYIRDTMSRYIRFHYDTTPEKKLVAVTVPSFNGSLNSPTSDPTQDRQTIRFYYETLNLQYQNRFNGTITVPNNGQIQVLKYVYFPDTKTGYRYDYSQYFGMIYKMTSLRGMQVSSTGLTATGSVQNEGVWAAWTKYNYGGIDDEPPPPYNDVPKYDKRFDEWQGRTGDPAIPETSYAFTEDAANTQRITNITAPDGTISRTKSNWKPGLWDDGLVKETSVVSSSGQVMSKTALTWEQGPVTAGNRRNPRIKQVDTTNEAGLTRATVYEYTDLNNAPCLFNNVCQVKEYDYAAAGTLGTLLRHTVTTYETGANYINNRLLSLVKSVKTIVGGQTVSRTEYKYDTQQLTTYNNDDIDMFDPSYNPATGGPRTVCEPGCSGPRQTCCYTILGYNQTRSYRGNLTEVKEYADAANDNDPLASVKVLKYDIAGNVVEATLSCCQLRKWIYSDTNQYAAPVEIRNGSSSSQITRATYDYNTGLMLTSTNENNQVTNYEYEPDTLRQKKTIYPNGGYTHTEYSDKLVTNTADLLPGFVRTTTTLEANKTVQSYGYYDGRGLGIRSAAETTDGWSISAVEYDNLGRARKSFNPFYGATPIAAIPANAKYAEVTNYDALGRTTEVKLQDDTTVRTAFGNQTNTPAALKRTFVEVTDQAGKKRRQLADALGRIVRVDEPDASGNLGDLTTPTQPTAYEYDANDNLKKVVQTDGATVQERLFKYDSLSRLTHERQVEANATLDDNGIKQTSGGLWTKVLKYNLNGLLLEGNDARGVKTTFAYDGLNRVQSVSYTGETGLVTPNVTYTYDQARSGFYNNGALTRVETAATTNALATVTEFDYDQMGRAVKHRQSIGTQVYPMEYGYNLAGQLTSQKYPSGKVISVNYDAKGRLSNIADQSRTYLNGLQYQGNGNSLSSMTFGNGTVQSFEMNDRMQMTRQELKRGAETLQKYDYGYGQIDQNGNLDLTKNNGQLARVESHIGAAKQWTQKFSYDSIGRLSESKEYRGDTNALSYRQKFDYDKFGNLYRKNASNPTSGQENPIGFKNIEETDISKATNRFTTETSYDDAGNVIVDNKFRMSSFSYDANGRMVKATRANVPDASSIYDASGLRVAEKVNDVWRFLIYDIGGKLIAEYGGLQSTDEGGVKYLLTDWQGSTRAIVSNSGFVQARMDYTAFGEDVQAGTGIRTTAQGFNSPNNNLRQRYGLTERDEATGLDHTWFRKNENKAGRWTSPDPYNGSMSLGNPQSFNRYSYVENQPTNFVDPSGLQIMICRAVIERDVIPSMEGGVYISRIVGWDCEILFGGGSGQTWVQPIENGGGIGIGGGGNNLPTPEEKTDCEIFVDSIVSEVEKRVDNFAARAEIGGKFVSWTRELFKVGKVKVSGFVDALVAGGQDSDVWRHVLFGASSTLLDGLGAISLLDDARQEAQILIGSRPEESRAAIEGNNAGNTVGALVASRIAGNLTKDKLREKIFDTLCQE